MAIDDVPTPQFVTGNLDSDKSTPPWRALGQRLLACNPFYLASAVLILYGIHMLWQDTAMISERDHLQINLLSLHLYELLLVAAAIALARRQVWYDATLLLVLEMLFLFIPFILLSSATWIDGGNAGVYATCVSGIALWALKWTAIRRFYPRPVLPLPLVSLGIVMLAINLALPIVFKALANNPEFTTRAVLDGTWFYLMPFLTLLVFALPLWPRGHDAATGSSRLLPPLFYAVWCLVTGYHLWAIGYVYDWSWHVLLLVPTLWAASWATWVLRGLYTTGRLQWRSIGHWLPLSIILCSPIDGLGATIFVLGLLNVLAYALMWQHRGTFQHQLQLCIALFGLVAAMPVELVQILLPTYDRWVGTQLALGLLVLLLALRGHHPVLGFCAATVLLGGCGMLGVNAYIGGQLALTFIVAHSAWWRLHDRYRSASRWLAASAALTWVIHTLVWLHFNHGAIAIGVSSTLGLLVIAVALYQQRRTRTPATVLLYAGSGIIALQAVYPVMLMVIESGPGVWMLAGGFGSFALGTAWAWDKERWLNRASAASSDVSPLPAAAVDHDRLRAAAALVACALLCLIAGNSHQNASLNKTHCTTNLQELGEALHRYTAANEQQFPSDLTQLVVAGDLPLGPVFACPMREHPPPRTTAELQREGRFSYVYLGNGLRTDIPNPNGTPLVYSNTGDTGWINVLFVSGRVAGFQANSWEQLARAQGWQGLLKNMRNRAAAKSRQAPVTR